MFKKILYFFIFLIAYFIGIALGICDGMEDTFFSSPHNSSVEKLFTENNFDRFISIAKNNIFVGLKNFLIGFFSLGILSLVYSFYNGFVLGFVIGKSTKLLTIKEILETTIPHCAEIIGIVLMGYLGFILSIRILFNTSIITDSIGESVPLYHSNRYHHITLIGTTVSLESVPTFILVLSIKLNRLSLH